MSSSTFSVSSLSDPHHSPSPSRIKRQVSVVHLLDEGHFEGEIFEPLGQYEGSRKSEEELKGMKKLLKEFYHRQNAILDKYLEVDSILSSTLPRELLSSYSRNTPQDLPTIPLPSLPSRLQPSHNRHASNDSSHSKGKGRGRQASAETDEGEEQPLLVEAGNRGRERTYGAVEKEDELEGEDDGVEGREKRKEKRDRLMLNVNLLTNLLLLGSKGAAVVLSNSISLLASFVDSALDLLSALIIWGTSLAAGSKDRGGLQKNRYPVGKKRFEPLGVLIFSVFMIASFTQVFIESVQRLYANEHSEVALLSTFGKATMVATILIKGIVWRWCGSVQGAPGVEALAQDAQNDVFFNLLSLTFPWIGERLSLPQLDPIGGCVLSLYIIYCWLQTLHENFVSLSGRVADCDEFFPVLYLVSRFRGIQEISSIEIYHVGGDDLIVEVDVCLPPKTSLHIAHDLGEVVQSSLERLEGVSRCFVHLDYSSQNPPQHLTREQQRERFTRQSNSHKMETSDRSTSSRRATSPRRAIVTSPSALDADP